MYFINLHVDRIINIEEKAKIVEEVMLDLPETFGDLENIANYIKDIKRMTFWVAKNDEEILGFISLKETKGETCEIHSVGVKKEYHNEGIGKKLYHALEEYAEEDYEYIQVKTMDIEYEKGYNQTIGFFKSLGFKAKKGFKTIWDEWNPVVVMVKKIR